MHIVSQRRTRATTPLCESCERVAAAQSVTFPNTETFLVCAGCAPIVTEARLSAVQ